MIIIILFYSVTRSIGRRTYVADHSDAFLSRLCSSIYENRFIYLIFFFNVFIPHGRLTTREFRQQPLALSQNAVNPSPRPSSRQYTYFDNFTRFCQCDSRHVQFAKKPKRFIPGRIARIVRPTSLFCWHSTKSNVFRRFVTITVDISHE